MIRRAPARWLAAVLALAPGAAGAGTTLSLERGYDHLDNGAPDWASTSLALAHAGKQASLHGEWQRIERFGLSDDQFVLGAHVPLALEPRIGLSFEFSAAPDPEVVAEFGTRADVDVQLPAGFVAHLGGRRANYPEDTATALVAGVEHYRGDFRLSAFVTNAHLQSGDSGTSAVLGVDRYYGEGSRIGVVGAAGDEASRIAPSVVVVTDVRSFALVGRHWLDEAWGVSYVVNWTEQGDFYVRWGGVLGLLYRF